MKWLWVVLAAVGVGLLGPRTAMAGGACCSFPDFGVCVLCLEGYDGVCQEASQRALCVNSNSNLSEQLPPPRCVATAFCIEGYTPVCWSGPNCGCICVPTGNN